jgi:hypothetical protein
MGFVPMALQEKVLLKMLEYEEIAEEDVYRLLCPVLNLQYFVEQNVHTLSALSFIMDISDSAVKITFVNEEYNRHFRYVEFYLSESLKKRSYTKFYHYLRMFTRLESGGDEVVEAGAGASCGCLAAGTYCTSPSLNAIAQHSSDAIYNIYTHRLEYHLYLSGFLFPIPALRSSNEEKTVVRATDLHGNGVEVEMGLNLAEVLSADKMYGEVFHILPLSGFYWRGRVNEEEVVVDRKLAIHLSGRLSRKMSFLFKNGKSLLFSLTYFDD